MKITAFLPAISFAVRHFLFVSFAIVSLCILWVIVYLVLLVIAAFGDQGLGSPLTLPAGLMAIIISGMTLGWGLFTPATATGAIMCHWLKLPKLAAIPFVILAAFAFTYIGCLFLKQFETARAVPSIVEVLKNFALFLSVPLGIYWWLTEGPGALFETLRHWVQKRRKKID